MNAPYIELHCHSYYSLLDGASSPESLLDRAAALGYPALALTDVNGLYGVVRFWRAAWERGIRPIIGAEVTLAGDLESDRLLSPPAHAPCSSHRREQGHARNACLRRSEERVRLVLLAETQEGYANLCRLLSAGQMQAGRPLVPDPPWPQRHASEERIAREERVPFPAGKVHTWLTADMLAAHSAGLICLFGTAHRPVAAQLREIYSGRFWIELQRHDMPTDAQQLADLTALAHWLGVGIVATNDVRYAERAGQRVHDVLCCIRHHTTLPQALADGLLHPNSERFLKSPREMADLFGDLPHAVRETIAIAERCQVSLDFTGQRVPAFPVPGGHTAASYLRMLCEAGLRAKYAETLETGFLSPGPNRPWPEHQGGQGQARNPVSRQMDHELAVIERVGLVDYFLVVWDIVRYARAQGIRCQGRGSAANSLVAYLLDITPVDPLRHNLLFERFLSEGSHANGAHTSGTNGTPGTRAMPDIDVDFAADRREEVIQYVYERYGEAHVGMVCNVVTYRARSALRDAAKALAFPPDVIDRAAKALDTRSTAAAADTLGSTQGLLDRMNGVAAATEEAEGGAADLPWQVLAEVLRDMEGIPRHLSIHVGGMLITAAPLVEIVPLERAAMPGRVVVQWDKDSVEDAGLIKIDLLSLRTLGMVEEALAHIERSETSSERYPVSRPGSWLEHIPLDDPAVYTMLQRADTVGCFQVESRAQAQMLPRLRPTCFEDLIVEVALVRPGPIQGNMVHPYLLRRQGLEPVRYAHPALEPILAETLGVMIFQEQVMRVAVAVAGFTPAEADGVRRAMSRSRSPEEMASRHAYPACLWRERFLTGAGANGVDPETAALIFEQLAAFSGYGFCKSHAAAFALVAYQTLYLKAHYPAAFYCALLNHQPMGFYAPEVLVGDARRHGVPVLAPDVNCSQEACTLERRTATGRRSAYDPCSRQRHAIPRPSHPVPGPPGSWKGWDLGMRLASCAGRCGTGRPSSHDPAGLGTGRDGGNACPCSQPCLRPRAASCPLVIRLGLRYVHGLGEARQSHIVQQRGDRPFCDLSDLCRRTRLPKPVVENLIRAGAMDGFGVPRRDLLWALGGLAYPEGGLDLEEEVVPADLPALGQVERTLWEYELLGLTPGEHLVGLYREPLRAKGVSSSEELWARRDGEIVRVAGMVVVRQRPPSAKGHVFFTLEDETGLVNLIVRPQVYERYRTVLRGAPLLLVEGRLQREAEAISVLVEQATTMFRADA